MVGYDCKDVGLNQLKNVLTVTVKSKKKTPEDLDDVFVHKGILDGDTYIKFIVSKGVVFHSAEWKSGVLYITFKDIVGTEESVSYKIEVEIKDATIEVSDDVELTVVKTEAGKADVVVVKPKV